MQLEFTFEETKRCYKCGETRVKAEFSKDKTKKDGLRFDCKSCTKVYKKELRARRIANPPPTPDTKRCTKCGEVKSAAEFSKARRENDGLVYHCKSCDRQKQVRHRAAYTKRNTLAGPGRAGTKVCYECKTEKQKTEFNINRTKFDGLAGWCKECANIRCLKWAKDNPAKANANSARRRAYKVRATVSWEDKRKTAEVYDEAQRLTAETGVEYDVDHNAPINSPTVQGFHVHHNLKPIPKAENISKGNREWEFDWRGWRKENYDEWLKFEEEAKWYRYHTRDERAAHLATLTTKEGGNSVCQNTCHAQDVQAVTATGTMRCPA